MWGRVTFRLILATAASSLALAGGAQAATLTLGSQFQGYTGDAFDFSASGGTIAQTALPSPLIAISPVDGTVTQWRFSGAGPSFTPVVIRPQGTGRYAVSVGGAAQPAAPGYVITGPFPLSLPIHRGDLFGYSAPLGSGGVIIRTGTGHIFYEPPLGTSPEVPDATVANTYELAMNATVRYCVVPALKKKTPKAARAALAAADCTVGKTKKSKKRRKKKQVLSQSLPPRSQVSDTAPVDIKVSRKR